MHRRSLTAVLAAVPLFLSVTTAAAMADTVSNSLDATAEIMPLNVDGPDGTTTLTIRETNGDGKRGCNLTGSTTLSVAVSSSDPRVATVTPEQLTFTSCGDVKTLTVHPLSQGSTTVSLRETSNTTGATFDLAPATFDVNVAAPPPGNTAPTISVGGPASGGSYAKGAVPTATCQVVDKEDGPSSFPATLSTVTGTYAADDIGQQTASCTYTDNGGVTASGSVTYGIYDPTAPAVGYTLTPSAPDGENGWYTGTVSLSWQVNDTESPSSLTRAGCADQSIIADQPATNYSCTATSAGGTTAAGPVIIRRDSTPPTVTYDGVTSGTTGDHGWYTSPVTVSFTATDALSGPATQSQTVTSYGDGDAVTLSSPAFTDRAGNTTAAGAAHSPALAIDTTAPTALRFQGVMQDGGSYYYGAAPATPTCTADDDVSGVSSCVVTGDDNPGAPGPHTYAATATNGAGLQSMGLLHYTVLSWTTKGFYAPVDMNGVWNTVKSGSTVPLKFEVFTDHELTDTSVVKSFTQQQVSCPGGAAVTDAIEMTTTGGTSLRYDTTAGQFIQNWQTPKRPGTCFTVTATMQDGSPISAAFALK